MARKRPRRAHWLNNPLWRLTVGDWIGLTLFFLTLVLVFCLFFIRRHTVPYHFEHTFAVSDSEFVGSALALADPILVPGNKIDMLQNGDAFFPAMLDAIRGAKKTINFEAFISYYHPTHSWRVDRTNRRSHRRILVVDGKIGFTGAVGFAEKWSGHAHDKDHWRDAQIRIEGPLVASLQVAFQEHWVKTFGEALTGAGQFPKLDSAGNLKAQVVTSRSFSMAPVPLIEAVAFTAATKRIWITNAYCTPTDDQVEQLVKAKDRHVDVRLLLPGPNNDQPLTKSAGRSAYGKMLEGGVKIFEYQPTMIHEKSMVVDGLFAMFGSSNLDARSSEINEELDVVVYDAEFSRAMESSFEKDLAQAHEYTLEQFRKRSLWERTTEWLMIPFRSQF
jgi:cardiolipin synthase